MKTFLKILSLFAFIAFFVGTRFPRMGTETFNTDEVYWHTRSQNFLNALITKNYVETFQKYHPGVPLMWEFSITALVSSKLNHTSIDATFANWEKLHVDTMLTLNIWVLALSLLGIVVWGKALKNWWVAILTFVVLNLEPFYLGNARLIHHDAQAAVYVMLGLGLVYLATSKKFNLFLTISASFFLALAMLTKSIYAGAFMFCLFAGSLLVFLNQGFKKALFFFIALFSSSIGFYFLMFPALWVAPGNTLGLIFNQSRRVGEDEGHAQIYFGQDTRNPGFFFYPVLFVIKTSIFLLIGSAIFYLDVIFKFFKNLKNKVYQKLAEIPFEIFTFIFYLGYFSVIQYFSKKVDRYVLPIYPFLALATVLGWAAFIKKRIYLVVIPLALFVYSVAYPLYKLFPDYLMYNSPVIGDAAVGNEIIGTKLFGIGIFDLREKIIARYGDKAKIGTSDFGPLKALYPNGVVYNVLVAHPNDFKVMILGPNKPFPPSLKNEPTLKFYKVDSVYINGLEFWRIYQKKVVSAL